MTSVGMKDPKTLMLIGSLAGAVGVLNNARDTFLRRYPNAVMR